MKSIRNLLKSLSAILLFSNPFPVLGKTKKTKRGASCVILGNGPSLKEALPKLQHFLKGKKVHCFNDFVASPYFTKIQPSYYTLMDSVFWTKNVSARFEKLRSEYFKIMKDKVDWELTLFFPVRSRKENYFSSLPCLNPHIKIVYVNTTELYSSDKINFFFYRRNLAMVPMQNVLAASIFTALNLGFKKIYLLGADHSWHESVSISEKNVLYLKNNRFQDEEEKDFAPFFVDPGETTPYKMHNLFRDLSKMFLSYLELERYARSIGAKVYNATGGSYIDAFERKKL